jgi:DNA (cytosine-5)-methyltransferase 1
MIHASLFSGIGGFDLAAEWMGWENLFHCEWNPFGQKVLKHHFPKSISYNDITKTDFSIHKGSVDILTGGFPCQPYSSAGKRLGKADERHLFPHMLRCIKEVKPRWIIGENVRGLVNWNGGMVFNEVCDDLEREGYEVQSFLIPAAGVNAPHQRYRVWFIAYSNNSQRCRKEYNDAEWENNEQKSHNGNKLWNNIGSIITSKNVTNSSSIGRGENDRVTNRESEFINQNGKRGNVTNSECIRLQYSTNSRKVSGEETIPKGQRSESTLSTKTNGNGYKSNWQNFPTKSPICGGNDGLPRELDSITFPKWRNESIKAYGNAIVPQVAHQIFKTINQFELLNKTK